MFKTIAVKVEDKERIKKLAIMRNLKEYEVISKLLDYYEKLEMFQHYLGCETVEELFQEIEELLPRSKKQLIVAETNKYIDKLRRLEVPEHIINQLSEIVYPFILKGIK